MLYYGRSVDSRVLQATCALASEQAHPTLATMARLERLLGYASAHPNARKVYRPSDMLLKVLTDASFLSRPKAGSVAASFHYLGLHNQPQFVQHPISAHSTRIPVVCSFVGEAEYAGIFAAARLALTERNILHDMGYPQPPTPIYCDNECAVGLSNDSIATKMSKSVDMRFNWIVDRVKQQQFTVHHIPGVNNVADFFTKSLPVQRHKQLAHYIAFDEFDPDTWLQLPDLQALYISDAVSFPRHHAGVLIS